ncbi:DUF5753 domain-containing protein [Amycolatopsis jiangsuensis]|uniref:DUF5753 domain-containing protein n=1 Tax=Amycolatopsis jiangsuensis TaxID=1181879 RepID=A0A840J028_9PSEU|nr:DUF5753 domain-containing protein [Amycolatopsis jiangsuensis]MBB4687430.1 hypothetical protein [Amycolatopsis jiangsuensis]
MAHESTARRASFPAGVASNWGLGLRRISEIDAAIYLASCGTPGPERDRLLEIIEPTNDLYWVRPDNGLRSLVLQENLASAIVHYEPLVVPGLVQVEGYARALYEDAGHRPDRVDRLTDRRMKRQDLLQRLEPPRCTFLIREAVLDTVVESPRIMHEQLQYLLLSANLPHCAVRVVPHPAAPRGSRAATAARTTVAGARVVRGAPRISRFVDLSRTIAPEKGRADTVRADGCAGRAAIP